MPCPAPPEPEVYLHWVYRAWAPIVYFRSAKHLCTDHPIWFFKMQLCLHCLDEKTKVRLSMARSGSHCQEGGQISSANLCWPLGNSRLNLGSLFNYSSSPLLSPIYDFRLLVLFPGLMPFVYICIFGQEWMNQWFGRKKKPPNSKLESFYGHEALFKHIPWWNKMLPTGSKHSHLMCNLVWCLWALQPSMLIFPFLLSVFFPSLFHFQVPTMGQAGTLSHFILTLSCQQWPPCSISQMGNWDPGRRGKHILQMEKLR